MEQGHGEEVVRALLLAEGDGAIDGEGDAEFLAADSDGGGLDGLTRAQGASGEAPDVGELLVVRRAEDHEDESRMTGVLDDEGDGVFFWFHGDALTLPL